VVVDELLRLASDRHEMKGNTGMQAACPPARTLWP